MAERDHAALWARAEAEHGAFAAARVAGAGSASSGRAVALLVVAFIAFAGSAALVRPPDVAPGDASGARAPAGPSAVETAESPPTSTSPPLIGRGWPPAHLAPEALVPVRIDHPAGSAAAVTDRFVAVRGELRVHAAAVRVSLQTSDRVTLDSTVVDTSNVDGGIRPLHAPGIDVQLALPTPRPTGERLWIVVTAYNGAGMPLGAVRRLVTIGEVADG